MSEQTADINVYKIDETYLRVICDAGIAFELQDQFSFRVPNYKFMPAYKDGRWDGFIRLFHAQDKRLYVGLLDSIIDFARENGYSIRCHFKSNYNDISYAKVEEFCQSLSLHSDGKEIAPEDYQIDAVHHLITNRRGLLLSPTSSGKSLIIYLICRILSKKKILITVPTTALVEQMYGDFADYSSEDSNWNAEDHIQRIYGSASKDIQFPITVSTWQGIYRKSKKWFQQFDVIIADECHQAKAASLKGVFEKSNKASYKIGTTGTLDNTQTNEMVIRGLTGPLKKATTTYELMMAGKIAWIDIRALVLQYPAIDQDRLMQMNYDEETKYLISHELRNEFIARLALSRKENTVVMFKFTEKHGKPLYNRICRLNEDADRTILYIDGDTPTHERERIRKITEEEDNAIIVASSVMTTGTNIRKLSNLIQTAGGRSRIRVLQSIGRTLRKHDKKAKATIYDIGDVVEKNNKLNHGGRHFMERLKYYRQEKMPHEIVEIELENYASVNSTESHGD